MAILVAFMMALSVMILFLTLQAVSTDVRMKRTARRDLGKYIDEPDHYINREEPNNETQSKPPDDTRGDITALFDRITIAHVENVPNIEGILKALRKFEENNGRAKIG